MVAKFNFPYLCEFTFFFLGVTSLLSFYTLVTQFYVYYFKFSSSFDNASSFIATLTISNMVPFLFSNIINVLFGQRFCLLKCVYLSIALSISHIPALIVASINSSENVFRAFFIISVAVQAVGSSLLQNSALPIASKFGKSSVSCFLIGQSVSGIFMTLVGIILISFTKFEHNAVVLHNMSQNSFSFIFNFPLFVIVILSIVFFQLFKKTTKYKNAMKPDISESNTSNDNKSIGLKYELKQLWKTFTQIYFYAISVFLYFTATFIIFPILNHTVISTSTNEVWKKYFKEISIFLVYNLFDAIGRVISLRFCIPKSDKIHFIISLLRFLFIPLFLGSNTVDSIRKHSIPAFGQHDSYPIIILALLSGTNGYFGSVSIVRAQLKFTDGNSIGMASRIMVLFLAGGLAMGSLLGFICKISLFEV